MSLVKNTAFMTLASIGQKLIAFVYFTIVARSLGAQATGMYVTALAFTTLFVVFVDLGMTNVLVRESAKHKANMQEYFSVVLMSKVLLGVGSYAIMIVAAHLLNYDIALRHLIYLSGITMLFDSLHLSIYGVLRAIGNLKYEAIGIVSSQAATLLIGGIALFLKLPLMFLILAFTLPSILNATYAGIILYKKYKIKFIPRFDKIVFIYLAKITLPFAIAAVFARVYSYIDTILLSKLAGTTAVGFYAIPYKITFAFQFIPLALVAALYPRFSEYFVKDKEKLAHMFEQGVKYLLIIVLPLTVGIGILAQDIIVTFYTTEYLASVLPLQILISGLVFSYISFPIGAMLNACNRQVTQTIIIGIVMTINIILNVIFIPTIGIVGAASAALIGNIILAFAGYSIIPQITPISHKRIIITALKLTIAAGIMGVAVFITNMYVHFSIAVLVGVVTYPVVILLIKAITISEIREAVVILKR